MTIDKEDSRLFKKVLSIVAGGVATRVALAETTLRLPLLSTDTDETTGTTSSNSGFRSTSWMEYCCKLIFDDIAPEGMRPTAVTSAALPPRRRERDGCVGGGPSDEDILAIRSDLYVARRKLVDTVDDVDGRQSDKNSMSHVILLLLFRRLGSSAE